MGHFQNSHSSRGYNQAPINQLFSIKLLYSKIWSFTNSLLNYDIFLRISACVRSQPRVIRKSRSARNNYFNVSLVKKLKDSDKQQRCLMYTFFLYFMEFKLKYWHAAQITGRWTLISVYIFCFGSVDKENN